MSAKKQRDPIPPEMAAKILFMSDRTCCVCRVQAKPVQIHHLDDNPEHNELKNFAVLCLDCHHETQIRGGFGRKLNADQVILYRDDWHRIIATQRAKFQAIETSARGADEHWLDMATSLAEIYRENQEYDLLAMHYDTIGNTELRDKYIEIAIRQGATDNTICFLRGLQGKPELIPIEVINKELEGYTKHQNWSQRARLFLTLGKQIEAAKDYVEGVREALLKGNVFSAAFYLKELIEEGLIDDLFIEAFRQAKAENDLWWQVRALQELGWEEELREFILQNEAEIEKSGDSLLHEELLRAKGDTKKTVEFIKEMALQTHSVQPDEED
ncbi:MAG: HNH endonuclease signature motif containing protein [Desulfobaccales bacterium]